MESLKVREIRVALMLPVLQRKLKQLEQDVETYNLDGAMSTLQSLGDAVERTKEWTDLLRNDPRYMNHPNILALAKCAYKQYVKGESVLHQKVVTEPWQQRGGQAYISTDDRLEGQRERERRG